MTRFRAQSILLLPAVLLGAAPAALPQPAEERINPKVMLFIPYTEYSQEDNQRTLKLYEDLRVSPDIKQQKK